MPLTPKSIRAMTAATAVCLAASIGWLCLGNRPVSQENLQYVAVFAVNPSMQALDYTGELAVVDTRHLSLEANRPVGNKLDMARWIFSDRMLPALQTSEGAVINYAGEPYKPQLIGQNNASPAGIATIVDKAVLPGFAPAGGSDISAALQAALDDLHGRKPAVKTAHNSQAIFLFSDGRNSGSAEKLSKVLRQIEDEQIRLVVIGLGVVPKYDTVNPLLGLFAYSTGAIVSPFTCKPCIGTPVPRYDTTGNQQGFRQIDGAVVRVQQDFDSLAEIAYQAKGTFLSVQPGKPLTDQWFGRHG